ncbi:MAG: hypothetical protein WBR26_02425 [Candidatus Acidiferrum sp.]
MNGELIFVNHPAPVTELKVYDSAGVAFNEDMACVAYVTRGLQTVEFFVNENEKSFAKCPYWPYWKKNCVMFKGDFNFSRVLLDTGRKARRVGFDDKEIAVTGEKYVPVPVDKWAPSTLPFIGDMFMPEISEHAAKDPSSVAAMVKYFWDSLRIVDGKKVLTSPSDPVEPIKAILLAAAAETIDINRIFADSERRISEERELKQKADEERERVRLAKREALLGAMRAYNEEHGYVLIRMLSNNFQRKLTFKAAVSLIDLHAAEFHP